MRNVVYAINLTLDGCCDHTKQSVDEEKLEYFTQLTREADLQIFGRKTWQLMVPYWPDVLKDRLRPKLIPSLPGHSNPPERSFFHDH